MSYVVRIKPQNGGGYRWLWTRDHHSAGGQATLTPQLENATKWQTKEELVSCLQLNREIIDFERIEIVEIIG